MFRYILAFGSNLGDRAAHFDVAQERLTAAGGIFLRETPRVVTAPLPSLEHDVSAHEAYLNMVCEVRCPLAPDILYEAIVSIEDALGHPRGLAWQPRALDVDILLCGLEPVCVPQRNDAFSRGADFRACLPVRFAAGTLRVPHHGLPSRAFLRDFLQRDFALSDETLAAHGIVFVRGA